MQHAFIQTYDQMQSVEAPPDVRDPAAEYREFFRIAHNRRIDEELTWASRTARFRAFWDTRSLWIKHEEERLAETADPNLCCFCGMPRRSGCAALRRAGGVESAYTSRHRVPSLLAHSRCLSAFRYMLNRRADETLAAYGLSPDFDD
jgi:hypothetical protein